MFKIKRVFLILITLLSLMLVTSCDFLSFLPVQGYTVEYETYDLCDVPQEKNILSLPEKLPSPTVEGYKFEGWYYDEEFKIEAYGSDLIVEDTTLYALWVKLTYTVFLVDNTDIQALDNMSELPDLPTPTKEGYNFTGWYYDQGFTSKANKGDELLKDVTLYAKWDIRKYTISFNTEIGTKPESIKEVNVIPNNLPTLKADGYKFEGWYSNKDLTNSVELGKKITSDITLYAKWTAYYSIKYNNNGFGQSISSDNEAMSLPSILPTLTETGYEFLGWYYDEEFTIKANPNDVLNKNVMLYAKWEKVKYDITFDLNGVIGTVQTQPVEYDEEFVIPCCDVENKGYKFIGWNTKADGTGTTYYEYDKVKNLSNGNNVTLYAVWEKIAYKLTIQLNNGQADLIYTLNYQDYLPSVNLPSKPNSEFLGWFIYDNGEEKEFSFINSKMPDSDLLIYAKYLGEVNIIFTINEEVYTSITGIVGDEISAIPTYTKPGYQFDGWYLEDTYQTPFNLTIYPERDITIYGKITPNIITINFNGNGNTGGSMTPQTIEYGSNTPIKLNTFVNTGYKFIGWEYNGKTYVDGYDKDIVFEGSITLKAIWEKITYSINYVINGHGTQPAGVKNVNTLPSTLPILIEEGFIFGGWYYDKTLTNKANVNDVITSNVTLYAKWEEEKTPTPEPTEKIVDDIIYDDFQIHFLELGNGNSGDSVYIKAGDNDILIDAGSRRESATTISNYINKYCTDGKLEYVIVTHGDQDHIAGFPGNSNGGIFYKYEIGTIIDFPKTTKTTQVYNDYKTARTNAISKGAVHYTAAQCFNGTDGAQPKYDLGEGISMSILYNYYYFNSTSDENDYSVCTMFTYNDFNFMFTGDLEESGENKMAAYYNGKTPETTLPKVELFKAGHHGSNTSSNECLLNLIQPEIVCVCCCAGGSEYTNNYKNTFPTQDMINRVAEYTDRVYVTTAYDIAKKTYGSLNGNIIISSNGTNVGVSASNNIKKLKDSDWFNTTIYTIGEVYCSGKGKTDFYTAATSGATPVPQRVWPS